MSIKLVVLLGTADWAGSGYSVCRAINRVGQIKCRHVSFYQHIFGYPSDIVIPIKYVENPKKATDYPNEYAETMELLEQADLIHLWNDSLPSFSNLLPLPIEKVKSCTFTGTLYRRNHTKISQYLKSQGTKLVVQNPTYRFAEEYDAEYIQHAVDSDKLKPIPLNDREKKSIGCYRPVHTGTTAREDIKLLENILHKHNSDWQITLDEMMPWEKRIKLMAKCVYFFEYMDPHMGYWGRSALEACSMGIPTFSSVSLKALKMSAGRFGQPAIINVERNNLKDVLNKYLKISIEEYLTLSCYSREWVEKFYSFETIGRLYTKFFNRILNS